MTRYIFITGGVVSSLGKGIVTSSLASLLKLSKFKLRIRKGDPDLNGDPDFLCFEQYDRDLH